MNATVFCNTCDQALCNECRRLIHSAKMFAKHNVVPLEKRTQKEKKTCGNLIYSGTYFRDYGGVRLLDFRAKSSC